MSSTTRLTRSNKGKEIGGVCAGIANYFNLDVSVVRIVFLVAWLMAGFGFMLYIILWLVLPSEDSVAREQEDIVQENAAEIKTKAQNFAGPVQSSITKTRTRLVIGGVIVAVGILALLRSFGLLIHFDFSWLWPALLIIIGLTLVIGKNE